MVEKIIESLSFPNDSNLYKFATDIKNIYGNTIYEFTGEKVEDLENFIKTLPNNSTVVLTKNLISKVEGHPLTFSGKYAYPENLTIDGNNFSVPGVSITSGIYEKQIIAFANANSVCDSIIEKSIMPRGLSFKNIKFTQPFSLYNCRIDNLIIDSCEIAIQGNAHCINIDPNNFSGYYTYDHNNSSTSTGIYRPQYAALIPTNLIITNCTILGDSSEDVKNLENSLNDEPFPYCGIRVVSTKNIYIYNNEISYCSFNGISIMSYAYSPLNIRGGDTISITDNIIKYTGSRSIRIANQKNANINVLANNLQNPVFHPTQKNSDGPYIKISGCIDSTYEMGKINSNIISQTYIPNYDKILDSTQLNQCLTISNGKIKIQESTSLKAGNGLQFNNNQFSIKIDSDSEKFLSVNDKGIKISGIQAAIEEAIAKYLN